MAAPDARISTSDSSLFAAALLLFRLNLCQNGRHQEEDAGDEDREGTARIRDGHVALLNALPVLVYSVLAVG